MAASDRVKKAAKLKIENLGNPQKTDGEILQEAGYSKSVSESPSGVMESKAFKDLVDTALPDTVLLDYHKKLLNDRKVDHMVFPKAVTDEEINELFEEIGCKVRKIKHGDTANHVWFWVINAKALKEGLDMAYKLKGSYAAEKKATVNLNLNADLQADPASIELKEEYEDRLFEHITK